MRAKEVFLLRVVADDLNDGKAFYDSRDVGVGDYFWDSLVADFAPSNLHPQIRTRSIAPEASHQKRGTPC